MSSIDKLLFCVKIPLNMEGIMDFHYEDLMYHVFIKELKKQKEVVEKREDLVLKNRIIEEIKQENERVSALLQELDIPIEIQDGLISDFQEFEAEKIIEYYNAISATFQKAYAIFENQTAKTGTTIDFKKYSKIKEMNYAVNVLKHRRGNSYNKLQAMQSKYLDSPKELLSIDPQMPANVIMDNISYNYSGEILNLEHEDLIEFFDEAAQVWADEIDKNKIKRESRQSSSSQM